MVVSNKHLFVEDKETKEVFVKLNPEWEKEQQKARYDIFLKKSKIPKDYWDLDFDIYKGNKSVKAFNRAKEYATGCRNPKFHNNSLYLHGEQSSQKSMVGCAIGKEFIRQGLTVRFILAGELINNLMKLQGFSSDEDISYEIKKFKYDTDLLIIDDAFDKNKSLMWETTNKTMIIQEWDSFLRHLISHDIRIIMTSNCRLDDRIKRLFGVSIFELVDRNFEQLLFEDNIKDVRKERLKE